MAEIRDIFVVGLDGFNRDMLATVRNAEQYRFHGLIPYEKIVNPAYYAIDELLEIAARDLRASGRRPDAIIGHWDFPTTSLLPLLQASVGLPGPSLEAALRCENKYATRVEQTKVAPETAPPFALVDPRDSTVLDKPPLPYPFRLKPVVAFSSTLGFRVDNREDFRYS